MSKYLMISVAFIIAGGLVSCLASQLSGIGDPSTATGIGAGVGLLGAIVYYLTTKDHQQG